MKNNDFFQKLISANPENMHIPEQIDRQLPINFSITP